jgi:bacterioferritin (cytochrome b1)
MNWTVDVDRVQEELAKERKRREVIHNDLKRFAVELSATSQVALIAELARIDNHIRDIEVELEDMKFRNIVNDYFTDDR